MDKTKLKIILVDDDEDDRLFFADALQGLQMDTELLEFKNGKDCIQYLESSSDELPNLIFLDLNMPVMNGFESHVRGVPLVAAPGRVSSEYKSTGGQKRYST